MRVDLDHNATAPLLPEARAAMIEAMDLGGNPSSVHGLGRAARRTVEIARACVAALVGARAEEVAFTSGGSEANALAIRGAAHAVDRLLVAATEHDSVLAVAADVSAERGMALERLPVDGQGRLRLDMLAERLEAPGRALVAVMLANNETGIIGPVAQAALIAKAAGALVHCDAAQAAGRIPVDMAALGVDYLTLSAHKFGGPKGAGALAVRDGAPLARQVAGGGQELGRRAGTENVPAVAGFGRAAKTAMENRGRWADLRALRDRIESRILDLVPSAKVHGRMADRLPNTTMIGLPGAPAETQVIALDLAGFCVSSGAACSSGKVKASHVLAAMGVDEPECAIRVSLGPTTTEDEIDAFVRAWGAMAERMMARRGLRLVASGE